MRQKDGSLLKAKAGASWPPGPSGGISVLAPQERFFDSGRGPSLGMTSEEPARRTRRAG